VNRKVLTRKNMRCWKPLWDSFCRHPSLMNFCKENKYTIVIITQWDNWPLAMHNSCSLCHCSSTSLMTQCRWFCKWSSQPITWLILTNKTIQENTQLELKKQTQNTANQTYTHSVASYNTQPRNHHHRDPKCLAGASRRCDRLPERSVLR